MKLPAIICIMVLIIYGLLPCAETERKALEEQKEREERVDRRKHKEPSETKKLIEELS